jgi:hypothetical protein
MSIVLLEPLDKDQNTQAYDQEKYRTEENSFEKSPRKGLKLFRADWQKTEPVTRHVARRLSFDGRSYGLLNRRVIAVGAVKLHRCAQSK